MRVCEEMGQSAASRLHVAVMVEEVVALVRALNPMTVVDATLPVEVQQAQVRQIARTHLERAKNLRVRP